MLKFEWDESFITKHLLIDSQHKKLVELINKFGEMLRYDNIDDDIVINVFNELVDYTSYHFDDELKQMKDYRVDERHVSTHVESHEIFKNNLINNYKRLKSESITPTAFFAFLTNWLVFHVTCIDKNLVNQINLIESGMEPEKAHEIDVIPDFVKPLLTSISSLFKHVDTLNIELTEINSSLEEKVRERTEELKLSNEQLYKLALTDPLTNLYNRRYAINTLTSFWGKYEHLSCMMIDTDHFKQVNDNHGHDAGDTVLVVLAQHLKMLVKKPNIVCRLGGDEFLIICPDTDEDNALDLATDIHEAINEIKIPTGGSNWNGSISIGVASRTIDMDCYDNLLKKADNGVYEAKRDGKNCVRFSPK